MSTTSRMRPSIAPAWQKCCWSPPGNESLRRAIETAQVAEIADVSLAQPRRAGGGGAPGRGRGRADDLVIYDRCSPRRMPQANALFLGDLPPGDRWQAGKPEGPPFIVDVDRVHPLTQLVDMTPVRIAEGTSLAPPRGSTVLMDSVIGPLYAVGPRRFRRCRVGVRADQRRGGRERLEQQLAAAAQFPRVPSSMPSATCAGPGPLAVASVSPGSPVTLRADDPCRSLDRRLASRRARS